MSDQPMLEPSWRPETYWPQLPTDQDLLGRIRGVHRREAVRAALESGDLAAIDPELLREALTPEERKLLMSLHPHATRGEYLPGLTDQDCPEGEVEIARLHIASGIGNTISVRARRSGEQISLSAVDEFEDALSLSPSKVIQPLANAELLQAVKTLEWHGPLAVGEVWSIREFEAQTDVYAAAEFITGSSEIYPAFAAAIEADNEAWLEELLAGHEEPDGF
jgi:hypothetical protein